MDKIISLKAPDSYKGKGFWYKYQEKTLKALKKNTTPENIILGPSIVTGCIQILKTGPNKGKPCGCNIVLENICKRHYLLNHKEIIIKI